MSSINFDNVYLLFIAIPLVVLFVVPFALAVRKDNANGHNITSLVLHVLMAVIIAFAAAGTSINTVLTETNVFVVADVSYSAEKNLDTIDSYIKNLDLPRNCKLGLVCFGKDAQIVSNMGDPKKVKSVKQATVDDSETNIAEALEYTGELFKGDAIKRIVLITDGKQTDSRDDYAITRAVDGLESKKIKVDAIYLDDNISSDAREVQISSVEYTKSSFIGREEVANVSIDSTFATQAIVELKSGDEILRQRSVSVLEGSNNVSFDLDTSVAGEYDYEVTINAEGDESDYNNRYLFTQKVVSEMRVLIISGSWGDTVDAIEKYGEQVEIEAYDLDTSGDYSRSSKVDYVNAHADNENLNIHVLSTQIPLDLETLSSYDEYIIAELDISKISGYEEFITNLRTSVQLFGKSLITIGNLYLQNSEDEALIQLEDMLPVNYGNRGNDPKLYTIVIDSSRSMGWLYHLTVAKQLVFNLMDLLDEKDEICITTFFGEVRMVQAPTPVTAGNRQRIIELINNLSVTQGTMIGAGLDMAYKAIEPLNYSDKQVMLISDGLEYTDESDDPVRIATDMYESGIVTSVFDVGRQGDSSTGGNQNDTALAARDLLKNVASAGHGEYYYSNNAEKLDEVTFGKIADKASLTVVEKTATVTVNRLTDSVLDGVETLNFPEVDGYMYSGIKYSATNVLTINHKKVSGTSSVPLYAYWDFGEGKVATFTSKIGDGWLKKWKDSGMDERFFTNVFNENMPDEKLDVPFNYRIDRNGTVSTLTVTPPNYQFDGVVTVKITDPEGETYTERLVRDSNFFYRDIESNLTGKYSLEITYEFAEKTYVVSTSMTNSYAEEYNAFSAYSPSELYKALNGRGEVSLDGKLSVENDESEIAMYKRELAVPLLITVAALYVIDIIIRKLKWEDIKSFFGFGGKSKKKGDKKS